MCSSELCGRDEFCFSQRHSCFGRLQPIRKLFHPISLTSVKLHIWLSWSSLHIRVLSLNRCIEVHQGSSFDNAGSRSANRSRYSFDTEKNWLKGYFNQKGKFCHDSIALMLFKMDILENKLQIKTVETFFRMSSFVFHRRKLVMQVCNDFRGNK